MSSSRMSSRPKHRVTVENQMIRRREKEFKHDQTWNGQVRYYKSCNKANTKFEEWTSPRYYETNNHLLELNKKKIEKSENLQRRRDKLRKRLEEEARSYEIELMVRNRNGLLKRRTTSGLEDVPTEVLKDLNLGLKIDEDERRRHEAELKLYHRWRNDNPIVREHERCVRTKDLKLSWLDQQIEKRMQKEKREEECKKIVEERNRRLEQERLDEERLRRERDAKNELVMEQIKEQIEYLKLKQKESDELRRQEAEETARRVALAQLEEERDKEERRKADRECALYNIRQHKIRLKQRARDVQENIEYENALLQKLIESRVADAIEDEAKKKEIQQALDEFLRCTREQSELEKRRRKYLDFVFDSEAKEIYERQEAVWAMEQESRRRLFEEVLSTVRNQIEERIEKNKQRQKEVIEERERSARLIEEANSSIDKSNMETATKKASTKKQLDEQVKEKCALKHAQRTLEERKAEAELEMIRKEEQRLKQEIIRIQRRQTPYKPSRSKIFL